MRALLAGLALAACAAAQDYRAERTSDQGVPVIRLTDVKNGVQVAVVPSVGNTAYEMKVHGKNILYFPFESLVQFRDRPQLSGIPLLAPWANRIDGPAFFAGGKKYNFDMELGNVNGATPIHGLLAASPYWEVATVASDDRSARYAARLEFWRHPELMAQWPFAHEYEMTYLLKEGELEVRLSILNLSSQPMPVVVGFHPYYQIPGVSRDEWVAHIPARSRVAADARLIPTGEYRPMDLPAEFPLRGRTLDDGFTDLERDRDGRARFYVRAGGMKVETSFGPRYPVAVVWSPNDPAGRPQPFVCIEPMAGVTNAANLAQQGKYPALQTVGPRQRWTESFWIKASGI
jgi:aldose 1-epimerase